MFFTASSPRSSPRATLILSAASTNCCTISDEAIPSLPASPASALSFSRGVRVSIRLNSSFIASTSSLVCPVYFLTSVIASSILAKSDTHLRIVIDMPVIEAIAAIATPCTLLNQSAVRLSQDCCALPSYRTRSSSSRSSFALRVISRNSAVPLSIPLNCWLRILMEYSRSRTLALSRSFSVRFTSDNSRCVTRISPETSSISLSY